MDIVLLCFRCERSGGSPGIRVSFDYLSFFCQEVKDTYGIRTEQKGPQKVRVREWLEATYSNNRTMTPIIL